jgi:multiple sugar transport system permease protein
VTTPYAVRRRFTTRWWVVRIAALLIVAETLAPFLWMIISSFSNEVELVSVPPHWIPEQITLDRYAPLLTGGAVSYRGTGQVDAPARAFLQSTLCLVLGALAAYVFSRFRFRFKTPLLFTTLAVQMIPTITLVIPLYFVMKGLGLMDTYLGLILLYSTFTLAWVIWIMVGYFATLPTELEDAARVDGCSRLRALVAVILPLSLPGLVATGALAFLNAWNEFLFALIFTNSLGSKTLPVVISEFSTQFGLEYGMMMAGGVLASLPPVLLALLFQRHIVSGLAAGGVKG